MTDPYSGDVTVTAPEQTPVELADPEDVFVRPDSVAGDLDLRRVEYVYTATPVRGEAEVRTPANRYAGDIEDGYLDREGVDGDAVVADAEDVYVAPGAVGGSLDAEGAEQVFHDGRTPQRMPRSTDDVVTGWQQSRTWSDPAGGVVLVGAGHDVTITDAPDRLTLYLTGYDHEVRIEDGPSDVTLHVAGRDNLVSTGPYVDAELASEHGHENTVRSDPVPVEDVIETTKSEAFGSVTIGRARVTYQVPATDEQWCPNCGSEATAIVERHYRDAFFLFGYPLYTFDRGVGSYNCEACVTLPADTSLSEAERRNVLQ